MKKAIIVLLTVALLMGLCNAGLALESATPEETPVLEGVVSSIDADAGEMLITGTASGDVLVRFESAVLDGVPTLYPGVRVQVTTNGVMTMSLPAQVNAQKIEAYACTGTVIGFEDGMLLFETPDNGMVAAHLDGGPRVYGLEYVQPGAVVTAFFDGILTRSIPAQLTADVLAFTAAQAGE